VKFSRDKLAVLERLDAENPWADGWSVELYDDLTDQFLGIARSRVEFAKIAPNPDDGSVWRILWVKE
jgi:hypothetical protein